MLKTWWESLSDQEHKLVIVGGSIFSVGLFYWILWSPLANAVNDNRAALDKQLKLNGWAKEAIVTIKSASGNRAGGSGGSLSQIVNQSSRQFNFQIGRMTPKDKQLTLLIDEVVFNDLLNWLSHLEKKQGVKINNLDLTEIEVPGKVRVSRLVIEKS
jgi:general secretion pathway protein M